MSKALEFPMLRLRERLVPRGPAHLAPPPEQNPDDLLNEPSAPEAEPIPANPA